MRKAVTVTPEMARGLIEGHKGRVQRYKVEQYKEKMLSGEWTDDNGFFVLIRDGKLINGLHRMMAVYESGIDVKMRLQYDI